MARKKVEPVAAGPTEDEKSAVRSVLYESLIGATHPMVLVDVRERLAKLLRELGREDLAKFTEEGG